MSSIYYNAYNSYNVEIAMEINPFDGHQHAPAGGERKASQTHGESARWTPSDAIARLVEEGLRRAEFGFIAFRDSPAGRPACIQGSTLAVWEVMLLVHSCKKSVSAVAAHLQWPEVKVQAAVTDAEAFPEEINAAMAENEATNFETLKCMLPQTIEFVPKKAAQN